jgi:hypothetical protein
MFISSYGLMNDNDMNAAAGKVIATSQPELRYKD